MPSSFDRVALGYDAAVFPLPKEYVDLVRQHARVGPNDYVVDLGCGSGLLTFPLVEISSCVIGVDSSKDLIAIASRRDVEHRIRWICSPVEQFCFGDQQFAAILSFEAFHLFPDQGTLIGRCARGLRTGGCLGIGWCTYHWEQLLKDSIVEVFARHGITWGQWGYQACTHLKDLVRGYGVRLSPIEVHEVAVKGTSDVRRIADYLTCIEKTSTKDDAERRELARELEASFLTIVGEQSLSGLSIYVLAYATKLIA